jgi:hypothetical protein
MDELVEFLAMAFVCLVDYSDLTIVFLDDFQWVDSFSWKIIRLLCQKGKDFLFLCATRSHDKQALRRLSSAASGMNQLQSQMVEISLGPLDFDEIRQLIAKGLDYPESAVSESLISDIFQRTGGLPVYVIQTLENVKRKETLELGPNGLLQWTAEGAKEQVRWISNSIPPITHFDITSHDRFNTALNARSCHGRDVSTTLRFSGDASSQSPSNLRSSWSLVCSL